MVMPESEFSFYYEPRVVQIPQYDLTLDETAESNLHRITLEVRATKDGAQTKIPGWVLPHIVDNWKRARAQPGKVALDPFKLGKFYYKKGKGVVFVGRTRLDRPENGFRNTSEEGDSDKENYAAFFDDQNFEKHVPSPKAGLAQLALAMVHRSEAGMAWLLEADKAFKAWYSCTPQPQLLLRLIKQMQMNKKRGGIINPIRRFMKLPSAEHDIVNNDILRLTTVTYTDTNPDTTLLNLFIAMFTDH